MGCLCGYWDRGGGMDDWKEVRPLSRVVGVFIRIRFEGGVGGGGGGAGALARSNCCILSACDNIRFGAGEARADSSLKTVPSACCGALLDELRCLR